MRIAEERDASSWKAPAGAVLGDRAGEVARLRADAQQWDGHQGGVDAELEATDLDRGVATEAQRIPIVLNRSACF
jgi:hypothetical protein